MRIIGGALAGRTIRAPRGEATRPTSDRVREAIFNRLAHGALSEADRFAQAVLDLYAGSGGLGLEALSRGSPSCDFVDDDPSACGVLRRNLASLGLAERGRVTQSRAEAFLRRAGTRYGLVFADPPYADAGAPLDRALVALRAHLLPGALVIVEHGPSPAPRAAGGTEPTLRLLDQRRYGQTVLSFFESSSTVDRGNGRDE